MPVKPTYDKRTSIYPYYSNLKANIISKYLGRSIVTSTFRYKAWNSDITCKKVPDFFVRVKDAFTKHSPPKLITTPQTNCTKITLPLIATQFSSRAPFSHLLKPFFSDYINHLPDELKTQKYKENLKK